MESSDSRYSHALPGMPDPARTTEERAQDDRRLAMQFLGSVFAIYAVIGLTIYGLVSALL